MPFYITDNTIDGFVKTDNGYTYKQNGLPSGELAFTLCTEENSKHPAYSGIRIEPVIFVVVAAIVACRVIAILIAVSKKIKGFKH